MPEGRVLEYCASCSLVLEGQLMTSRNLLSLELDHRISKQVSDIQLSPLLDDIRMLAHQQPPNVGEEEASAGIVGISVCL